MAVVTETVLVPSSEPRRPAVLRSCRRCWITRRWRCVTPLAGLSARIAAASAHGFPGPSRRPGFTEIHAQDRRRRTEGGANVFPVDYFGRPAYLAQSPQFYKQIDGRRL